MVGVIIKSMRTNGTSEQLSKRRQRALELLKQGKSVKEAAAKIKVSEHSVRRWRQEQKYPKKKSERLPGRAAYLLEAQLKNLEQELLCGAFAHGYSEDYWTLDRVGHVIWTLFKISYTPSGVWRLLDRMNWSCQKVQRIAIQRNDEAIVSWHHRVWPRIKKVAHTEGYTGTYR